MKNLCKICKNFFSKTRVTTFSDVSEIESKCLISNDNITSSTIVLECTHSDKKEDEKRTD